MTASFPSGLATPGCGTNVQISTSFPSFQTTAGLAPTLDILTWKGVTAGAAASRGLANSGSGGIDNGPILASSSGGTTLTLSTLDNHKIIAQSIGGATYGPITSLWSAGRNDQIACLSAVCAQDQVAQGDYVTQRIEGWGVLTGSVAGYVLTPLSFRYSAALQDNWVGSNSSGPDATYNFTGSNGFVFAAPPPPGTVPLAIYRKDYGGGHIDWAAVASPAGLSWASSNGYSFEYTAGFVFPSAPGASDPSFSMGISAAIPSIPSAWSYSVFFSAAYGGATAGAYSWGAALQAYSSTHRSPAVTLTDIGYYTDDGAYYYVWSHWLPEPRPWAAEEGLLLVKENLIAAGVPIRYMQLDDWWYQGAFYFGNVKSVTNWTTDNNDTILFPHGLPAFSDALGISLQLYTPFWADNYVTPYNMTESTVFSGTKLVTPPDSYAFFSDLFDLGSVITNGRFSTYEIDFLESNFAGSASMFEDVYSAYTWYAGMADAALERGITIQYCLPSPTDILVALDFPAVVQARASGDYVSTVANALALGGSSLLYGALSIAPSKDTLWTTSLQPNTSSDTIHWGYYEQPHTQLDCVLATLSLGPVGISDALNYTDVPLISQSFVSATDGTLLRPSRPLSWVDSYFSNTSAGAGAADVRGTHASVPASRGGGGGGGAVVNSHSIVAWRTATDATLGPTDLYPPPPAGSVLAVRPHVFETAGSAQQAGCVDGQAASPSCVSLVSPAGGGGGGIVIPATGMAPSNFTLVAIYEPICDGAYFLGELSKFVHVSPQRFEYILCDAAAPPARSASAAGITVGVHGTAGQVLVLTAIDSAGIVHVQTPTIPPSGFVDVSF